MRTALKCLALFVVLLLPATVFAQASLTGTVRDASGGVLPGVTVEAASPALIEKVRSAVTDDTGQYRIIDLRPGTYSLTFTLPGFSTVIRDKIELTGSQTLTIPVELRVGGLEETITVTGESPVVDVQNARTEIVLNSETIQTIPATRAAGALLNATPGIYVGDAALSTSPAMTSFNARSSTINATTVAGEGRYAINGFPLTAARSGGFSSYVYDTVNTEEVAITVGGGLGDSDVGGPIMNIIPRSGSNNFAGTAFLNNAGDWSSGNNLTDEIQAQNPALRQNPGVITAYDWSASVRRSDHARSAVVLRQLPRPQLSGGDGGHPGQRQRRRPGALGLGRVAHQRAAGAGPHDDHRAPDGAVRGAPHPGQLRVPAPLRGHAAASGV